MLSVGIINAAIKEAKKSSFYPFRLGAVIFNHNSILSVGYNQVRSNHIPNEFKHFYETLHCETAAVLNYKKDLSNLKNCEMLVIRISRSVNNNLVMAKPCIWCERLLRKIQLKRVYYSNDLGEIVSLKL